MQISPDRDNHLRINRHTAPTWKTCWMMNTAHCWAPQHRDSPVQQDEEEEHESQRTEAFFGLKCLRLKCKQDDSRRPQQRGCGSFTAAWSRFYIHLSFSLSSHEQDAEMHYNSRHLQNTDNWFTAFTKRSLLMIARGQHLGPTSN